MAGLFDAFKQYVRDAAPGGALNPEVTPSGLFSAASVVASPVPIVGDVLGAVSDVNTFLKDPESRTPLNFALAGMGLIPMIPAMTVSSEMKDLVRKSSSLFSDKAVTRALEEAADPKAKETIALVRPDDFLKMAAPLENPRPEKIQRIKQAIAEGKPLDDIPYLHLKVSKDQARATTVGHEGRHRALVFKEMGIEYMPVRVVSKDFEGVYRNRPEYINLRNEAVNRLPSRVRQEDTLQPLQNPFIYDGLKSTIK
jgi:hypothetical protein